MKTLLNGSCVSLNALAFPLEDSFAVRAEKKQLKTGMYLLDIYIIRHGVLWELTTPHVCHRGLMTASCKGK